MTKISEELREARLLVYMADGPVELVVELEAWLFAEHDAKRSWAAYLLARDSLDRAIEEAERRQGN